MTVALQHRAHRVLATDHTPTPCEADEELAILAGTRRRAIGIEGRGQACHVRDVLDERLLPIDRHVGERPIGGELLDERPRGRFVLLLVLGAPPVSRGTRRVVVGAERIDEVTHFVAEDRPDGAIGRSIRGFRIELQRLQLRRLYELSRKLRVAPGN